MNRIFAGAAVLVLFLLTGQAESDEVVPMVAAKLQDRAEIRIPGEDVPSTKSLKTAIEDGSITFRKYEIQPNDTLSGIVTKHGLRADPMSIDATMALNDYTLDPRKLKPGETIVVLDKGTDGFGGQWEIILDEEKKSLLDKEFRTLRSYQSAGIKIGPAYGSPAEAVAAFSHYKSILGEMGKFRVAGYAADPRALDATWKAISAVNAMMMEAGQADVAWRPTIRQLEFLAAVDEDISLQAVSAYNYDHAYVPVEVATRNAATGETEWNLSVCFRPALEYYNFIYNNPGKPPTWDCRDSFDTLSSPSKANFRYNVRYVIWADRAGAAVSDYAVITIRPNQADGRCRRELPVNG